MRSLTVLLLVALALPSCSDDDGGDRLSLADLANPATCPVPLAEVVGAAGQEVTVTVDTAEDGTVLGDADGVLVECITTADGEVSAQIIAVGAEPSPTVPSAVYAMVPYLMQVLELTTDEISELIADVPAEPPTGVALDLGVEGPVAIVPIEVDDAATAAIVVTLENDGDAVPVAEELADVVS